jgi:hypothetical protein
MTTGKKVLAAVLGGFVFLNLWAVTTGGLSRLVDLFADANPWAILFAVDLSISLGLVLTWMARDARARGQSIAGWIALTLATGSIGPLLYLLRRR